MMDLDFIFDVPRNARIDIISFSEVSRVTLDPLSALVEVDGIGLCVCMVYNMYTVRIHQALL